MGIRAQKFAHLIFRWVDVAIQSPWWRERIKLFILGAPIRLLNYVVYVTLLLCGVSYLVASVLAVVVYWCVLFVAVRRVLFSATSIQHRHRVLFGLLHVVSQAANMLALWALVHLGLSPYIAQLLASVVYGLLTHLLTPYIFRK